MTITIVTDSAAALPEELVARYEIRVVPLWIHLGNERYRDAELPLEDVLARPGDEVTTAAPSPGEFATTIEEARTEGDVVVLTVGGQISTANEAARLAAKELDADVTVLDTGTAAGAQALVVLAAATSARQGATVEQVEAIASRVAERVRLVATVPDLERLASSGRVPEVASRIGGRLGVQPLFEFRSGKVHPIRPALSREAALDRMVQRCAAGGGDGSTLHVAVVHALDPDAAEVLETRVATLGPASCFVAPFSSAMVAHTGRDLAGLAWWRE